MLGSLLGDIVGSIYEHEPIKTTEFEFFHPNCHFTDETVLTLAIANAINRAEGYQANIRKFAKEHADVPGGFGNNFKFWLHTGGEQPYKSIGVGPAARVSPVGWAFEKLETTLIEAEKQRVPLTSIQTQSRGSCRCSCNFHGKKRKPCR